MTPTEKDNLLSRVSEIEKLSHEILRLIVDKETLRAAYHVGELSALARRLYIDIMSTEAEPEEFEEEPDSPAEQPQEFISIPRAYYDRLEGLLFGTEVVNTGFVAAETAVATEIERIECGPLTAGPVAEPSVQIAAAAAEDIADEGADDPAGTVFAPEINYPPEPERQQEEIKREAI